MSSVERVRRFLQEQGLSVQVKEMDQSTRTAPLAAAACGCPVGAIVKSLLFLADGRPVLVMVSGDKRADPRKIARLMQAGQAAMASADAVRSITGYAIGGVPPVAHNTPLMVFLDGTLLRYDIVWAAAGAPNAVFPIAPGELLRLTGARAADVTEEPGQ